jgi:hypothetical protein
MLEATEISETSVHLYQTTMRYIPQIPHTRDISFYGEGPRSRCYGRAAALSFIVQPCDEDWFFFLNFSV